MIQSILLTTGGSASAERAADFAASLATRYGAKVTVLHSFTPVSSYLDEPNYSRKLHKTLEEAKSLVVNVAKRLREMGVMDVDRHLGRAGSPRAPQGGPGPRTRPVGVGRKRIEHLVGGHPVGQRQHGRHSARPVPGAGGQVIGQTR